MIYIILRGRHNVSRKGERKVDNVRKNKIYFLLFVSDYSLFFLKCRAISGLAPVAKFVYTEERPY